YTYVVVIADSLGRTSPPSSRFSLTFIAPPRPPGELRAEPGEREVRLNWQAPTRFADDTPVAGPLVYEIPRASTPGAPPTPLPRTAPGATATTDRGLENDRNYYYAVRAIRREGTTVAEGEPSSRVAATPTDVTPPAAPTDLVAIPSEREVRLSWTLGTDTDLAGYVIYRAAGGGPWVRVGSVRVPATTFTDRGLAPGIYRYAVTAQDASVRANESPHSNEVSVTVP